MESITETVKSFFKQEATKFEQMSDDGMFEIGFAGQNGCFLSYVAVDEEERTILVETVAPVEVLRSKRLRAAELIARINRPLLIGNFDLNMDTGLISYKTSIILGNSNPHNDLVEHLLFANWSAMDKYFPAVNMVIFADVSPKRAVEAVRKPRPLPLVSPDDTESDEFFHGRLGGIWGGSLN